MKMSKRKHFLSMTFFFWPGDSLIVPQKSNEHYTNNKLIIY